MSDSLVELIKVAALDAVRHLNPCNVFFGTVIQDKRNGEELIIETDDKLVLPESVLILARDVTDYQTWISFDDPGIKQRVNIYDKPEDEPVIKPSVPEPIIEKVTDIQFIWTDYRQGFNIQSPDGQRNEEAGKQPTKHLITVYNHLMLDERVILIRQQGGQRFIVIDRIGATANDSR